jgi:hypothetical protein
MALTGDIGLVANIGSATAYEAATRGIRNPYEIMEVAGSQYAGRWAWEMNKQQMASALGAGKITPGEVGMDLAKVALQAIIQGTTAFGVGMVISKQPRNWMNNMIPALIGSAVEEGVDVLDKKK